MSSSSTVPHPAGTASSPCAPSRRLAIGRGRSLAVRSGPPNRVDQRRPPTSSRSRRRVADLFAGIGGFHLGFEQAGAQVVFASEIDRHARTTYTANFQSRNPALFSPGTFVGDITQVNGEAVPSVDVVTAGFPCQPFSYVGRRRGFDDVRGTLFFDIARIVDHTRPAALVLENVPGLMSQDGGRAFDTIRTVMTERLGYSFHHQVIRACDHNLPQLRPRVFMVGFRDPATPFSVPQPVPLRLTLSTLLGGNVTRDVGRTILARWHLRPITDRHCFDSYEVNGVEHRMTVDEVRQMQGFPDWFRFSVAESYARTQLGNAVAVPVARAVARSVLHSLDDHAAGTVTGSTGSWAPPNS